MKNVWKSNLANSIKLQLFRATAETILLYGSTTWSISKADEKSLDGTRMLRMVKNVSWKDKVTNRELYGKLVTNTIRNRRMSLSGHIFRDKSSPAQQLITWIPKHGNAVSGRPTMTYIDTLLWDTGLENVRDLENCMRDRAIWSQLSSRRLPGVDRK